MCTICGCGAWPNEPQLSGHSEPHHRHGYHDGDHVAHDHRHQSDPANHFGAIPGGVHLPAMSEERIIRLERDILSKNDAYAQANRARLTAMGLFALNLISSPGSGKTSLLVRTITDLRAQFPIVVIEGDQQTSNDADRIRATAAPAVQINSGKGCHLDAHMVGHALDQLPLRKGGLLFIENVGNLICPAAFDLGEAYKVIILSVTEGEDKPVKYPEMFARADLMLFSKMDLLPHLDFDVTACTEFALRVNPWIDILLVSARTAEGMPAFYRWIEGHVRDATKRNPP